MRLSLVFLLPLQFGQFFPRLRDQQSFTDTTTWYGSPSLKNEEVVAPEATEAFKEISIPTAQSSPVW
jgi:hypothetical protein